MRSERCLFLVKWKPDRDLPSDASFLVIAFNVLKSTQKCVVPSFLGTNTIGLAQGLTRPHPWFPPFVPDAQKEYVEGTV